MAVLPLPPLAIDADPITKLPAYSGASFRAALAGLLTAGTSAGVARTGALDARAFVVSLAGSAVSVAAGGFAVGSVSGVYLTALTSPLGLGNLAPADPTNARVDRVVLRVDDPTNGGGAVRAGAVEIITGTPSATPALPAVSGTSVFADLARIDVPRNGGGAPAVTDLRARTAASGGVVPVATKAELDTWVPPVGTQAVVLADGVVYSRRASKWMRLVDEDDTRLSDTGWVNVPLRAGFAAQGGILPQVRRVGKRVDWRWGISNTGLTTADTTYAFADIPVGYRPTAISAYGYAAANTSAAGGRIDVSPAGVVTLRTGVVLGNYYVASLSWYID